MNKREVILWMGDYSGNGCQPNFLTLFDNKPFFEYELDLYQSFGFQHIVIVVPEKNHPAVSYFGKKYKNMKLTWAEAALSVGTFGAVKEGMSFTESENVLAASAAVLLGANFGKFFGQHCKMAYPLSMVVSRHEEMNKLWAIDATVSGRVRNVVSQPFPSKNNLYLTNIYLIQRDFLLSPVFDHAVSLEKDVIERFFKTEYFQVMLSNERFVNLETVRNAPEELSTIKNFDFEYIVSDIEKNQSQLELVS